MEKLLTRKQDWSLDYFKIKYITSLKDITKRAVRGGNRELSESIWHPCNGKMIKIQETVLQKMISPKDAAIWVKNQAGGRSQDGGGIGRGDHFLFYKFIERTTERWTKFTKQLLITSSGHQVPRKAAHCLQREGEKNLFFSFFFVFLFFFFFFFFLFFLFFCLFFSPISF